LLLSTRTPYTRSAGIIPIPYLITFTILLSDVLVGILPSCHWHGAKDLPSFFAWKMFISSVPHPVRLACRPHLPSVTLSAFSMVSGG
jgi:hypothetical protein